MRTHRVFKYIGIAILGIAFVFGVIFIVQALWNSLIPGLFNGPQITYWQTAGLFLLSKILLAGIAPGPQNGHKKSWRKKCEERMSNEATEPKFS
ncbi:MAG TPA: hypothetical protein VHO46_00365 [Bacteroidales bacterium]|nr:hypothetical protein [Bacteroidales bacterium]